MTVSSPTSQANGEPAAIAPMIIQMPKAMIPNEIRNENASFMMTSIPKKSVQPKTGIQQAERSKPSACFSWRPTGARLLPVYPLQPCIRQQGRPRRCVATVSLTPRARRRQRSALSLTPQWWSLSKSSPTSNATVTWSDSSSLSARNSQASAADRSFLRWRLSCVACVIFSLAFARHSAAVVILGSDLSLPKS